MKTPLSKGFLIRAKHPTFATSTGCSVYLFFVFFFSFRTTNRVLPRFSPSSLRSYWDCLLLIFPVTTMPQFMLKGRKLPCSLCSGTPSNGTHSAKPDQRDREQSKHDYSLVVKGQGLCTHFWEIHFYPQNWRDLPYHPKILCLCLGTVTHWQYYQWPLQTFHFTIFIQYKKAWVCLFSSCTDPPVITTKTYLRHCIGDSWWCEQVVLNS